MFPQPIRAGVKPAPTTGRPTRWVGAGFIPARTERIAALTSPLESLNLGGYYVRYVIGRFLPLRSNHVAGSMLHLS